MDAGIGPMLTSSRSLREYLAMFALAPADLHGRRVLDCPGGASAFTAGAAALGADAVAVDPSYGDAEVLAALAAHAEGEVERGAAFLAAHAHRFVWRTFADPAQHRSERLASAREFGTDVAAHPERYVAASLPDLPFPDGSFDLVLSSHLLFTYDDRLDAGWHAAALLELLRVSRGQVRVFPLLSQVDGGASPLLAPVRAALAAAGATSDVVDVDDELQAGGTRALVVRQLL